MGQGLDALVREFALGGVVRAAHRSTLKRQPLAEGCWCSLDLEANPERAGSDVLARFPLLAIRSIDAAELQTGDGAVLFCGQADATCDAVIHCAILFIIGSCTGLSQLCGSYDTRPAPTTVGAVGAIGATGRCAKVVAHFDAF